MVQEAALSQKQLQIEDDTEKVPEDGSKVQKLPSLHRQVLEEIRHQKGIKKLRNKIFI